MLRIPSCDECSFERRLIVCVLRFVHELAVVVIVGYLTIRAGAFFFFSFCLFSLLLVWLLVKMKKREVLS